MIKEKYTTQQFICKKNINNFIIECFCETLQCKENLVLTKEDMSTMFKNYSLWCANDIKYEINVTNKEEVILVPEHGENFIDLLISFNLNDGSRSTIQKN